jgi:hypothetical protein
MIIYDSMKQAVFFSLFLKEWEGSACFLYGEPVSFLRRALKKKFPIPLCYDKKYAVHTDEEGEG